jgi:hypothetical protein
MRFYIQGKKWLFPSTFSAIVAYLMVFMTMRTTTIMFASAQQQPSMAIEPMEKTRCQYVSKIFATYLRIME